MTYKYKLIHWNYDKDISPQEDCRKCRSRTIYSGNNKKVFLNYVKKQYQELQECITNGIIDKNKVDKIKYKINCFECLLNIDNQSKLFFDIDKIKINLNDLPLLLNEFFDLVDVVIGKKLNRNKYLVFYKKLVDKDFNVLSYTHSLRIINFEYKISFVDVKKLILLMNERSNTDLVKSVDTSVYHYDRQMGMPYTSKPYSIKYTEKFYGNKFKPEESVNHFLIYFDFNGKNYDMVNYIEKYSINCIDGCDLLQIKEIPSVRIDALPTEKDYSNRTPYHVEKNKSNLIQIIKENVNDEFYGKKYSKLWCKFVYYFKCLDIDIEDINSFLKYSTEIDISYNYNSNLDWFSNRIKVDTSKCYDYVYSIIAEDLTKIQEDYYFYVNCDELKFKLIAEWIATNTDLSYYDVADILVSYKNKDVKKLEIIKITNNIIYNYKTGNLYVKDEEYCKNYYLEQHLGYYKENNYDDYDLVLDDINDSQFKKVIEDFKIGKIENLAVEMDWGGGKSYHIAKPIIEHFCNNKVNEKIEQKLSDIDIDKDINDETLKDMLKVIEDVDFKSMLSKIKRIIAFSPNNSLNKKEYQDLRSIKNNCFVSHIKIKSLSSKLSKLYELVNKQINENETGKINDRILLLHKLKYIYKNNLNNITSIESSWKIKIDEFSNDINLVVMDEFNSLFGKFNATMATFNNLPNSMSKTDVFNKFIEVCKKAKQRLILDADIEKHKLDFYSKVVGINNIYRVKINGNIFNNSNIADDGKDDKYKILLCENRKHLTEQVISNMDKKITISTTSSKHGYFLFKLIISNMYDKNLNLIECFKDDVVGYIFGDGLYIYNCRNPRESIIDLKIDKISVNTFCDDANKECVYKRILEKYEVDKQQTTIIKRGKDEFLDDYESYIINKYKITKLIRSPTISVGISFNTRYFDLRFNYSLWGSVECYEALQMWFRERKTNERVIYFCFNNYLKDYNKKLFDSDNIIKRHKNNHRIATTSLLTLLQDNNSEIEIKNDFYEWKLINEINNENCSLNYEQIFMELLHKHSFNYGVNIHVLNSRHNKINFIDETQDDSKDIDLHNLLNTNITTLTRKDYKTLMNKKDENELTNAEYLMYKKYILFSKSIYYAPYIINNWYDTKRQNLICEYDDRIKEYDTEDEKYIYDVKKLNILKDEELWEKIIDYNKEVIKTDIETEHHYNKFKLHEFKNDFKSKYHRLKSVSNIILYAEDEEFDKEPDDYKATNKLIFALLEFLEIDIERDFKKNIIKHFIVDNTKKEYLTPIKEIFKNTFVWDDKPYTSFIDFINTQLLRDYNNTANLRKHKPINIKKLDADKNLLEILTIIKFYLAKVNLYIDYGSNIDNKAKLLKSLQFTIRKEHGITTKEYIIPQKVLFNKRIKNENVETYEKQIDYKYHNIMNEIINEEFCNNNKKFDDLKEYIVCNRITPLNQDRENVYIEKDITNNIDVPTTKTIYKDVKEEYVIEDVYGNKIVIKPISTIKLGFGNKYFTEDKSIRLNSELYPSYNVNTRDDILNNLNSVKVSRLNFTDLINQKVRAYNHNKDCIKQDQSNNKKRRYTQENYDTVKRNKLLNRINMEIKRPVKDVEGEEIYKIKYNQVIEELVNMRTAPLIIKNENDYMQKFLTNLIEAF